ncbi:T9SS type B sorting domain-containing protein [Winogradskyella aurantiaca]|uniref:T9SS type B sorting domain-containing protein n=1 Tax=Winogradskyella aurantiaca TaxID=2219558 RepID=UPI000E1CFC72|nr:choice-of-anchor L domain-containing protein [Winogradskyella aurantiaca]
MKRIAWLVQILVLWVIPAFGQQVSIVDSFNAQQLIEENLIEGCVEISNISSPVNGNVNGFASYGYFERGGSNFPFENGIVLSTGNVRSGGNVPNGEILNEGETNWGTDTDLENVTGINNLINATAIQFDFVSVTNQIQFNYILASEEYFANFPCLYSDGFAFLIREAGTNNPWQNIALVPGTTIPVNTNTVHDEIVGFCGAQNDQYFDGYNLGDTNFNGRTEVLTATAVVTPNIQYTIKLVIADQTDENYDSAVFIEGKSFNATVDLGEDITTCASNVDLTADLQNSNGIYSWYLNNVLIPGANQPSINVTQSGNYKVVVEIPVSGSLCPIEDSINVNLSATQPAEQIPDFNVCDDPSNDGLEFFDLTQHNSEVLDAVPAGNYAISYHYSNAEAISNTNAINGQIQNTSNPQLIFVRIEDTDNGCLAFSSFQLVVNSPPVANAPSEIDICDNDADGVTEIDLSTLNNQIANGQPNTVVSYHYTPSDANTGNNPIAMPYVNNSPNEEIYIRLENTVTGCYDNTSLIIRVTPVPDINLDPIFIDACDADFDGYAIFDLTSVTNDILNGLAGVTLTFHESYSEAFTNTNPITDPSVYMNIIANEQVIYVRVEDDATGCFIVREIEIHTNLLLTETVTDEFSQCDIDNDGSEAFNLNDIALQIINGIPDVSISFHLSEIDRDTNSNALDPTIPFFPTSSPQTLWVRIQSTDCLILEDIDLILTPITEFPSIGNVEYCDDDQDGYTSIELRQFDDAILNGAFGFSVEYYETETDALNNANSLGNFYDNIANPQTIYYGVTEDLTGCTSVNSFNISVIPSPTANNLSDQYICDMDQDGIVTVNLEDYIPLITSNTTNLDIDFFLFRNAAENDVNAITNPTNFSTNGRRFFARVESVTNGCYNIAEFRIRVNTIPIASPIDDYIVCNNLNTGVGNFVFSTKDDEIRNGQNGKEVLYFTSEFDADNRINSIDKNNPYQNISNPQTIYVRIENDDDINCYVTTSFNIEVGATPNYNIPSNIFICDDISNDGISTFDFNSKVTEIENGINDNLSVTFHSTLNGAENGNAPLPLNYVNTSNPQQIYVRITNGTACYTITNFEINVIQVPQVTQTEINLNQCDSDYDGLVSWDLTESEIEILDVRQDNIAISYHESYEDAENDDDIIFDPENYSNTSNPQTVYIRINNTVSNCFVIVPINLFVDVPPVINEFETIEICDNPQNSFNLGTVNSIITDEANNISYSYHSSLIDAQNGTNDLSLDYTYQSNNDTIFARVMYESTGCAATYEFQLVVNPNPIVNQAPPLQTCDDESNNASEIVDLLSQNSAILGAQNPNQFSVYYYQSEQNAINGIAPLNNIYNATHNEIIYVRVENNVTSCFNIGSFEIIVRPHPTLSEPLMGCDNDYDGITALDLTVKEADIASTTTGNLNFTYYESLQALEDNSAPISNPDTYTNFSNPQTVYIKVSNLDANCSSVVPMQIQIDLPPVLNQISAYEICENETNSFLLSDISSVLVNDSNGIIISYYQSQVDAEQETNVLNTNYTYNTTNDIVYARVKYLQTQCYFIQPITIIVNENPQVINPNPFEVCDDSTNNGIEGIFISNHDSEILNGLSSDDFAVSYYKTSSDAESGTNPLPDLVNANHIEMFFARVENRDTGCFSIVNFEVIIHPHPETPSPIVVCDTDYDETLAIDLTIFESDILSSTTGNNSISYFESIENLEDNTGVIINPTSYTNFSNPQTVFIKVENTDANCYSVVPLEIEINSPPLITDFDQVDLCQNPSNTILLSDITNNILVESGPDVLVNYFLNQSDAENEINSLPTNYNYQTNNFQIFANVKFLSTQCSIITEVNVVINEVPVAFQPPMMEDCDDDQDGQSLFNLGNQTEFVIGNQNGDNLLVTYYRSENDALLGNNMLEEMHYAQDGDIIYARIENVFTLCYSITEFEIEIHPPRPITNITDQVICRENLPLQVDANTGNSNDTYLWSSGETTPSVIIEEIGDYSVTITTPFGCQSTAYFSVIESEQATIVFTEILDFSENNSITIEVEGIGDYMYILDDGEPQESNVFNNVSLGYHIVTIIDLNGCANISKEVLVIDVPKFFTPNNDGDFDTWHIIGVETLPGTIVKIFDRRGKHIETLSYDSDGWDGNYNGLRLPATDYWYIADVKKDNIEFQVKGHFALRR